MVSSYWEKRRNKESIERKTCPCCNSKRFKVYNGNAKCERCGYYLNVNY